MAEQKKMDIRKAAIVVITFIFFCFQLYLARVKQLSDVAEPAASGFVYKR